MCLYVRDKLKFITDCPNVVQDQLIDSPINNQFETLSLANALSYHMLIIKVIEEFSLERTSGISCPISC